jgi:hypothetical protein
VSCHAQQTSHRLVNGEYPGSRDLSRLSFKFDEQFRFHDRNLNANQPLIDFSTITLAKNPNRTLLKSRSGCAKKVWFDLSRQDAVPVIFTLNGNVQYDARWIQMRTESVVDMDGKRSQGSDDNPVDIASLVRQELDSIQSTGKESGVLTGVFEDFEFQVMPFGVAVVFSLIGTVALMFRVARRTAARQRPSTNVAPVTQNKSGAPDPVDAILGQARVILQEKALKTHNKGARTQDDRASEYEREFRREEAESRIADQMERVSLERELEKRLRARQNGQRDSIALAKKLGIGRGEIELAASLRKLKDKHEEKE